MGTRKVLLTACALAAALPWAWAQAPADDSAGPPRRGPGGPPLLNLDTADADGDGLISLAEFESVMADRANAQFTRMDANADGVLSMDEFQKPPMRTGDGERPDGPPPGGPPPDGVPPADGEHGPPPGDRVPRPGPPDPAMLDTDQDGSVTFEEYYVPAKARADQLFARLDTDGDGSLNATEAANAARQRPGKGAAEKRGVRRGSTEQPR